jgi:chondroitin AC lyase
MKITALVLLTFMTTFPDTMAKLAADESLSGIRKNCELFYSGNFQDAEATNALKSMKPDGSWENIDYANKNRGHWKTREHLSRLEKIAQAYANKRSAHFHKPEVREAIVHSLSFWAEHDFTSPNWWHQSIGTPQTLCAVLLCLGDDNGNANENPLSPGLRSKLETILARSRPGMTGQNKVWLAGIHLQKGVLFNDPGKVSEGASLIASEVVVAPAGKEGIQGDWSFHQHGPQLQFGNYGLAWWTDMTKWAQILADTAFAFPPEKIDILADYFNRGLRWTLFDGQMDLGACGRQINQRQMEAKFRSAHNAARRFQPAVNNRLHTAYDFSGNRFFHDSDYMVHRAPECFFSVKMSSTRVTGSESTNAENLLGRLLGFGATMTMSNRKEILETGALWNWRQIPGVTSLQDDTSLECKAPLNRNDSAFVGGVSDGDTGFCVMEFNNNGLRALKSYFFSGRAMACIGSRISGDADAPVYTTVAQHHAQDDSPSARFDKNGALVHGAFRYQVPAQNARVRCEQVTGNWKRVTAALSDAPVTGKIFSIVIDHGTKPQNASYFYTITHVEQGTGRGGEGGGSGDGEASGTKMRQLQTNSDTIHAIGSDGATMVAFFSPGSITLPNGQILTAKQPSLVMLDNGRLHVADPARKHAELEFNFNGKSFRIKTEGGKTASVPVSVSR